jgi:DNA-binding MurR/RpiR family transcriptional regulator
VTRLATKANVSAPTVLRMVELGFDGFAQFQESTPRRGRADTTT